MDGSFQTQQHYPFNTQFSDTTLENGHLLAQRSQGYTQQNDEGMLYLSRAIAHDRGSPTYGKNVWLRIVKIATIVEGVIDVEGGIDIVVFVVLGRASVVGVLTNFNPISLNRHPTC